MFVNFAERSGKSLAKNGPAVELLLALSEPRRLQIIELLRSGPLPVNRIVRILKTSQPLVSKHLRVLREAGLVESRAIAQQRIYSVQAKPLKELDEWLESFRHVWDNRFDRLDRVLKEELRKERVYGRKK